MQLPQKIYFSETTHENTAPSAYDNMLASYTSFLIKFFSTKQKDLLLWL